MRALGDGQGYVTFSEVVVKVQSVFAVLGFSLALSILLMLLIAAISLIWSLLARHRPSVAGTGASVADIFSLVGIGLVGISVGYTSGISRVPIMGAVIPATLTFIGGAAFIVGLKEENVRLITAIMTIVFIMNFLVGASVGTDVRERGEIIRTSMEYQSKLALDERDINDFRLTYGLSPLANDWREAYK